MMTTANCGHCSGLMIPDPLDGGHGLLFVWSTHSTATTAPAMAG